MKVSEALRWTSHGKEIVSLWRNNRRAGFNNEALKLSLMPAAAIRGQQDGSQR